MKRYIIKSAASLIRIYFQQDAVSFGKTWLWNSIVRPYILWRDIKVDSRTKYGAVFSGSLRDMIQHRLHFFGVWEPYITKFLITNLKQGDVFVDVGANVGTHALLAAKLVGPSGRVHAIDASPTVFAKLKANIARNGVSNIDAYNMAAVDTPQRITVFLHRDTNIGKSTIMPDVALADRSPAEASVDGLPIGDIVGKDALSAARMIKIDVEGAEWMVLQGLLHDVELLRPDAEIIVEINVPQLGAQGCTLATLLEMFREHGFHALHIPNTYNIREHLEPVDLSFAPVDLKNEGQIDVLFTRTARA